MVESFRLGLRRALLIKCLKRLYIGIGFNQGSIGINQALNGFKIRAVPGLL